MAVTKIWRIKGRIDNVINYASNTDKTTFTETQKQALEDVIEYAANEDKTENVVVKLFCNICGLNLLDCCLEAIGTVRFYQWCFAPLRGHAIDKICHFRFFAITQSNQETCFRRPLCCCPHLVWCAVTVIAMWAHMIVGSIGEFLHRVIEFLFRPKFVQIRAFVL